MNGVCLSVCLRCLHCWTCTSIAMKMNDQKQSTTKIIYFSFSFRIISLHTLHIFVKPKQETEKMNISNGMSSESHKSSLSPSQRHAEKLKFPVAFIVYFDDNFAHRKTTVTATTVVIVVVFIDTFLTPDQTLIRW